MTRSDGTSLRICLSKGKKTPAFIFEETFDSVCPNEEYALRPLTLYLKDLPETAEDDAARFCILVDTNHANYEKATLSLHNLAEPKTRGTIIEEYCFSQEKIAWLGGELTANDNVLKTFFSLCNDSPARQAAIAYVKRVIGSYRFARMVLHRMGDRTRNNQSNNIASVLQQAFPSDNHRSVGLGADYTLESDDITTLREIYENPELSGATSFPSPPFSKTIDARPTESHFLPIAPNKGMFVKQICMQKLNIRMRCEYDFHSDTQTRDVPEFRLRNPQSIRKYQNEAIESTFKNGRACSGLVVLPCGAGKTLTGISVASRISKRLLILCVNTFSVYQWRDQLLRWTTISPRSIAVITASMREHPADIVITTYTMLTMEDERRNDRSRELISAMLLEPFGLVLLDEVHMAAAKTFRRVVEVVKGHCFLGLTATLLREDEKIDDLDYLIGPLLYECSMYALKKAGSIADVVCAEVLCPFPRGYLLQYLNTTSDLNRRKLYNMNPEKIWCCQALIHYHETRSPPDKTLVFVDSIAMLEFCARLFKRPMIHGETNDFERDCILSWFKNSDTVNTMFISRIGDSALDIPETNVIIQLSSLFGSQRTEVQRIGRIQRLKSSNKQAFFYSLVTPDTREVAFSTRRKKFLLSEGYGYNILTSTDITSRVLRTNDGENASAEPLVVPFCIGPPSWGFQGASPDSPIPLSIFESIRVEKAVLYGKDTVRIHGTPHEIPHAAHDALPPLSGRLNIGPLVRMRAHAGFCVEECLQAFLAYIKGDSKDYLEFTAARHGALDGFESFDQKRPKGVEKTVKAHTESSAFKRRDREIHKFRKNLMERSANARNAD